MGHTATPAEIGPAPRRSWRHQRLAWGTSASAHAALLLVLAGMQPRAQWQPYTIGTRVAPAITVQAGAVSATVEPVTLAVPPREWSVPRIDSHVALRQADLPALSVTLVAAAASPQTPKHDPPPDAWISDESVSPTQNGQPGSSPEFPGTRDEPLPRVRFNPPPEYPPLAVTERRQGVTLLRLVIGADGRVRDAFVARSSGHADLDQAALMALRRWRFERSSSSAAAQEWIGNLPVRFTLAPD